MMKKEALLTLEQAREIAKAYPTPFHIYNECGIRENTARVTEAFSWNKGFRKYSAVKATPNPFLLKISQEYGHGVDCSSETEFMMSDACGFLGEQIIFSPNDTSTDGFAFATKFDGIINPDDITHTSSVEEELGQLPETMSCRYNPDGMFELSNGIMDNPDDSKYGITPTQITEALRIPKTKGVKCFGLHTFFTGNTTANEYYPKLAGVLFREVVYLKEETGVEVAFINLSGGVGVPYRLGQQANDILTTGREVWKVYEEIPTPAGLGNITAYAEVGHFMLTPYGALVTKTIHEKYACREYIGTDTCAVSLTRPAMYGTYHHITVLDKEDAPLGRVYDVTSSFYEDNGKFAIGREPPRIEMGDYLYIYDTGTHGFSMGYNYNGKLRSAELPLRKDGFVRLVRRTETPKDYFAIFDFCNIMDKYLK